MAASHPVTCGIMSQPLFAIYMLVYWLPLHIFLFKASTEFEDLIASLNISKGSQQAPTPPAPPQAPTSQSDGPLSPQSFAMVSSADKDLLRITVGFLVVHKYGRQILCHVNFKCFVNWKQTCGWVYVCLLDSRLHSLNICLNEGTINSPKCRKSAVCSNLFINVRYKVKSFFLLFFFFFFNV